MRFFRRKSAPIPQFIPEIWQQELAGSAEFYRRLIGDDYTPTRRERIVGWLDDHRNTISIGLAVAQVVTLVALNVVLWT